MQKYIDAFQVYSIVFWAGFITFPVTWYVVKRFGGAVWEDVKKIAYKVWDKVKSKV